MSNVRRVQPIRRFTGRGAETYYVVNDKNGTHALLPWEEYEWYEMTLQMYKTLTDDQLVEIEQWRHDWIKIMQAIAEVADDEMKDADDSDFAEEFDPWECLRQHRVKIERLRKRVLELEEDRRELLAEHDPFNPLLEESDE